MVRLTQNEQCSFAPEARPQTCRFTADVARALIAPREPQIYLAIELILKKMLQGPGFRAMTITARCTIAGANTNLTVHCHHVPFAGIHPVYAHLWENIPHRTARPPGLLGFRMSDSR